MIAAVRSAKIMQRKSSFEMFVFLEIF